ncbi:MAG: hypothetical protein CSA36_07450 [Draconibacterium sp.]|nr:MAG: hypothetical protein CSA36_07450 [Draconibacterium sp.]
MKKLVLFAILLILSDIAFSGGLLTNTNQSAQFIRMMSRNASFDIDAVYFNPAGLIKLEDGWHFALYNQTIFQDKNVESKFLLLNDGVYKGGVKIPFFPTAFAVYKNKNWAFSLGFGPNSGGGLADFERGLPSFEIPITKVVPKLAGLTQIDPMLNVTGYDANLYFNGSSVYWGIQLGATYKISDFISVYGGVRYMPAKNSYSGYIRDIMVEVGGESYGAPEWLLGTAGTVSDLATQATGAANTFHATAGALQPVIDGGAGALTLEQLENNSIISPAQSALIKAGLGMIGFNTEEINAMNISTIQGNFTSAGNQFNSKAEALNNTAETLSATSGQLADKEVETEQTGAGFTPIIGVNISPNEDWNIALKYEHITYLKLKNKTKVDGLGLFPDGAESSSNVPAILGVGVGYRGLEWLEAQVSYNLYFNKGVDWGMNVRDLAVWKTVDQTKIQHRAIEKNGFELGLGLQFNILDNFSFSIGGLYGDMGVAPSYQSDFSYSNPSFTPAAGIMWKITDKITLDAGVSNSYYQDQTVIFNDPDIGSYEDVYGKTTLSCAVGLSFSIF